jgi:hypothetical protein
MPRPLLTRNAGDQSLYFVIVLIAAYSGCSKSGPAVAPVKGTVLLDGKPMTKGTVITMPAAGRGAKSPIASDGSFQLGTFTKTDGAIVGTHSAAVIAYEPPPNAGPESPYGKLLVPKKYASPESSGLTIDVPPEGKNDVVLNLTTAAQPKN